MKPTAIISLLALLLVGSFNLATAQEKKCPFNLIGTWKAQISATESRLYTFDADGVIKVLEVTGTDKPREIATAKYEVENDANTGRQISFTANGKDQLFGLAKGAMKVVSYDDSTLTCDIPGIGETRWTRVDPNRYFIVLVARQGEFFDKSGSAFPLVIKLENGVPQIEGAGIYSNGGKAAFGAIPVNAYKEYLREARGDSEVILRLEINAGQYARSLKIVKEWQRRARQDELLYTLDSALTDPMPLNNILVVKAVTETLNLCQYDIDLYKLDYEYPADWIANQYGPEWVPFMLFKELRKRNEARHIEYKKFQELVPLANTASR
ncbi:MAG TPA: hypothetical protein VHH35_21145 [Pyrinomonadaceae bacterium]|nr:hypothetical protein [Pyrinomonadaceae bacterium]